LDGVSSTIELFPSRKPIRRISYLSSTDGSMSIFDVLHNDWQRVGDDLAKVIGNEKTRVDSEK
jgi:hypothetical protein